MELTIQAGFDTRQNYLGKRTLRGTIGASIVRIEFWGPLYYSYNKEPQNSIGSYSGPCIRDIRFGVDSSGFMV